MLSPYMLRHSIWEKDTKKLENALAKGNNPMVLFPDGVYPLYTSIINGNEETTEILLRYGANPKPWKNNRNGRIINVLYSATLLNMEKEVYHLLNYGANPHSKTSDLCTPYKYASINKKSRIMGLFHRASKKTIFTLALVANRLSGEDEELPFLPREIWRNIVVQFNPIGFKVPF